MVSNDERNLRRWRLGQLGFIVETALWMLVVNALAHDKGPGHAHCPPLAQRKWLYDELLDLFDIRLGENATIWQNVVSAQG